MLPKIQRSIFHLGEKGGGGDGHRGADIHQHLGGQNHGRRPERQARDSCDHVVVGLQIVVQHHRHHPQPCHVVLKQMVSWPPARHRSFSRACCLCRRELNPTKDVYMYRGDKGFCSEECRRQQILTDDAIEYEAMFKRERQGLLHRRHHHTGHSRRRRSSARPGEYWW